MKIIRAILIVLVVLTVIVVVGGFLSPREMRIERSATINAPAEIVHDQVNNLVKWNSWNPWWEMDTTMKLEYNSIASGPGASYKWESEKMGKGDMTITSSTPDSISTILNMEYGPSTAKFIFTKAAGSTTLTWIMISDNGMNPVARFMCLFFKDMIGKDFEKGLSKLKKIAEAVPTGPKTYRGYEIKEEDATEKTYIIKKDSLTWDSIETFCRKNTPALFEAIGKAKVEITGAASSLYFHWDSVTKTAVMAVAVPVVGDAKTKVKGYETLVVPAGKNLHIVYMGGYSNIGSAHFAMSDYMKEHNFLQGNPVTEEYITGSDKEADSAKWVTNVYYRVR